MMSLWDALRMNMMISYQELVRTFLNSMRVSLLIYRHVIVMSVSVASLRSVAFVDGPVAVMMTY